MSGIWSTIEVNAWSRGLDYKDYRYRYNFAQIVGTPLSEEGYKALCKVLSEIHENDWTVRPIQKEEL